MPFTFQNTDLPGVVLIEPKLFRDARGFVLESYKHSEFLAAGLDLRFVQENHSCSAHGVLRGLHYQRPPHAQAKLIRVVSGEVFDVAVDIREGSPTFGKWIGVSLSAANNRLLYIPAGFAHGFCVVSDQAEVVYKTTAEYAPQSEHGARWDDPALGIAWPISDVTLSDRDRRWPGLIGAKGVAAIENG
jgi:dTDP-4-dehydrorhamnose 3,5-epimerase